MDQPSTRTPHDRTPPVQAFDDKIRRDIARQRAYEKEGAAAALGGAPESANPYDRKTDSVRWNHWLYGHTMALSEISTIERGYITVTSTAEYETHAPQNLGTMIPVDSAIARGMWRPQFVRVPKDDES